MRTVRILLGTAVLALGLWSGIRLLRILSTDPATWWADYLILIFPAMFFIYAAGLFHLVARKNVRGRRWGWKANALLWGASATVFGVLRQTSTANIVPALIGGVIAPGILALILHAIEADRREPDT